ncbi:uncharacterized protein LOC117226590 [Megalopta genalis]|uniref:uncharacterized protein LOC117226590 n=1 Tax=Megalopta genalis TaxID=115081 RepID=UPI0014431795|nr:uncharacterized protein LOC117226590 [Megalopta genalis]
MQSFANRVVTFQAWIRGILTRKHLRLLWRSAIIIQKHWRGYYVRSFADRYLVERVHRMWQDYYDRMATRIQAAWRGYWVRKTVLDIPKMRRWLENVSKKNEETVEKMKKFRRKEIEDRERAVELDSMQWILFILFKLHHLLRTKQRPGVVTRIDKTRFTFIEQMLKCFEYKSYTGRDAVCCHDCDIDPKRSSIFRGTYYERCEREIREIERKLRTGAVPVFRSFPYEKQEEMLRAETRQRRQATLHAGEGESRTKAVADRDGRREMSDLYDKIKKMDCQLGRARLKCPIHACVLQTRPLP